MPTPARLRHGFQARVRTAGAEHGLRRLQHALAIAHRIGAGLANLSAGRPCGNLDHDRLDWTLQRELIALYEHGLFDNPIVVSPALANAEDASVLARMSPDPPASACRQRHAGGGWPMTRVHASDRSPA